MVNFTNQRHTFVNPKHAAVQRQVIILSVTPLHVGVEAVVGGAALVLIPQTFLRGLLPLTVDLHDALGAKRRNAISAWIKTFRQSALSCKM